jgi:hypothetical protein
MERGFFWREVNEIEWRNICRKVGRLRSIEDAVLGKKRCWWKLLRLDFSHIQNGEQPVHSILMRKARYGILRKR